MWKFGWFMVFNANSAIIQLYHGENKLILLMLMKGDLVWPYEFEFWILVFNATISNISAVSRRPVLVVEEAGVPEDNHRPWASNW